MRIRAVVPLYPPRSLVGSWITTHEFLRHLVERGHDVDVVAYLHRMPPSYVHEGVFVTSSFNGLPKPDVVIGHVGDDGSAEIVATREKVPLVAMVHGGPPDVVRRRLRNASVAIFNSKQMRKRVGWNGLSIVAHPPVRPETYQTEPGDRATLVNLSVAKGAETFYALAERMPEVPFLGVRGGYGPQIIRTLANVTSWTSCVDMRLVYHATRVLLVPSEEETWGRVAIEAACSGIPTIAHPSAGVKEALGDAGIYVDRDDIDGWHDLLDLLSDDEAWQDASDRVLRRMKTWDPDAQLVAFTEAVEACGP